jgi:hypothetical protein
MVARKLFHRLRKNAYGSGRHWPEVIFDISTEGA